MLQGRWKLVLVSDKYDGCQEPVNGPCRNLHGLVLNESTRPNSSKRYTKMSYDAPARHPAFCSRQQLYDQQEDPLEQRNVIAEHAEVAGRLRRLVFAHVALMEAATIVHQNARTREARNGRLGRVHQQLTYGCDAPHAP